MSTLMNIKKRLAQLEQQCDWVAASELVYSEWKTNKNSCNLGLLLIQQMVMNLQIIDGDRHTIAINDFDVSRRRLYLNVLREAISYSLQLQTKTVYYYWQMCLYYYAFSTYYWVLPDEVAFKPITFADTLSIEGRTSYPNSLLLQHAGESLSKGCIWQETASKQDTMKLKEEVNEFCLQSNMVDESVKDYFFWLFE